METVRIGHQARLVRQPSETMYRGYWGRRKARAEHLATHSVDEIKALLAGARTTKERTRYMRLLQKA